MTTKTDNGSLGRGTHAWAQRRTFPTPRTIVLEEPEKCTFVIRHMNYDTKRFFTGSGTMTLSLRQRRPDGTRALRIWRNLPNGRTLDVTRYAAAPKSELSKCTPPEQRALWDGVVRLYARTGTTIPPEVQWVGDRDAAAALTLLAYPALTARVQRRKRNKLPAFDTLPDNVRAAARTDSAHAFARSLFGARMLRRDIVREAITAPFDILEIAVRVKHLVPVDWIAEFLTTAKAHEDQSGNALPLFYGPDAARFARFLETVPMHRRRKLLLTLPDAGRLAADTCLLAADLVDVDVSDCRTWTQFHDTLALAMRARTRGPNRVLPAHPIGVVLHDQEAAGLHLTAATTSDQLDDWGNAMHNCIGSYAPDAIAGAVVLFGLHDAAGALVGNLSVGRDGRVWECLGKYNNDLPPATESAVRSLVQQRVGTLTPAELDAGESGLDRFIRTVGGDPDYTSRWPRSDWAAAHTVYRSFTPSGDHGYLLEPNAIVPDWLREFINGRAQPQTDVPAPTLCTLWAETGDWFAIANAHPDELEPWVNVPVDGPQYTVEQIRTARTAAIAAGGIPLLNISLEPHTEGDGAQLVAALEAFYVVDVDPTHPGAAAAAATLGVPGEPARWNAPERFAEDAGAPGGHVTAWEWL